MAPHHLVSLPFSHYSERARWALDLAKIRYTESTFMPGFSQLGVMLATRGQSGRADRVSSAWSTPALRLPTGRWLQDSGEIVDLACKTGLDLRSAEGVSTWEKRLHDELGPHTRRMAYFFALQDPRMLRRMADSNVGRTQARLFKWLYPLAKSRLRQGLRINATSFVRSRVKVDAILDEVAAAIEKTGYLVGNQFSAADLTFACMAAPLLLVQSSEGFGAHLPPFEALAPEPAEMVREARSHSAGRHALRMFEEHRH